MKILKFGGSSLKSASDIKKLVDRIRNEPPRGVVVSAVGGTTDLILEIIASAKNGNDVSKNLESLFQQFLDIASELELEKSSYLSFIEPIHFEAQNNLIEIKENIRFFSKSKDSIVSIGERLAGSQDDGYAMVMQRLIDEGPFSLKLINLRGAALGDTVEKHTSSKTIYEMVKIILQDDFSSSFKKVVISVSMKPGATTFEVIFLDPSSLAKDLEKPTIPDFDEE